MNCYDLLPKPIYIQFGFSSEYKSIINNHIIQKKFFSLSEYYEILSKSKLMISHLGAGSLINSKIYNVKSIFLTRLKKNYEHIDDHQLEFFNYLINEHNQNNIFIDESAFIMKLKSLLINNSKIENQYQINSNLKKVIDSLF
jgi:UDP-N-acetylglucosamine transferase subunit ALG13